MNCRCPFCNIKYIPWYFKSFICWMFGHDADFKLKGDILSNICLRCGDGYTCNKNMFIPEFYKDARIEK